MKTTFYSLSWYNGECRGTIETSNPQERTRLVLALAQALGYPPHETEVVVNVPPPNPSLGPELPFGKPFMVGPDARETIPARPARPHTSKC